METSILGDLLSPFINDKIIFVFPNNAGIARLFQEHDNEKTS